MDREQEVGTLTRVLSGDVAAYRILVDFYKKPLFNLAFRMTGNRADAEDLAQETFVRAFHGLDGFDQSRRFFPWLYTIGLNTIRRHLKKQGNTPVILQTPERADQPEASPEEQLIGKQRDRLVQNALLALQERQREAVVLRYIQGLSFEETARILGVSTSAAKMRVYRGLDTLKTLLPPELIGED